MYRLFTVLTLIFFSVLTTQAQDSARKKTWISISAGFTNSTVYGSMVNRNEQFGENVTQTNRGGFMAGVLFETPLHDQAYLKYGAYFIQKNVNPMKGTYAVYKDQLKVGYISLPLLAGYKLLPAKQSLNVQIEAGPSANVKISDKSTTGPDRVGFKTAPISVSFNAGTTFSARINEVAKFLVQYRYLYDLSNAHVETLWWSGAEPNKEFTYKYKTHTVSLGLQWEL